MSTPAFNTGMAHMQSAIDEGKRRSAAATSGGAGKALNYINWKPGDKKILRFLTDDVMTENFMEFIVDKKGETRNFMVPPNDPHILDRYRAPKDSPLYPLGWRRNFKTHVIEEPKPRKIGLGIAVLRDEKPGEGGLLQLQDYLYEQEIEGTQYLSRHFGIIQQSVSNFWHTLAVSCFKRFGTICDRDYEITREGEGLDTKYSIIPLTPDPDLATVEAVQEFYYYGKEKWNDEDPDRFLKCPQTLAQWAEYFSHEDRYKHWLVPDGGVPAAPSYTPPVAQGTNPLLAGGGEAQDTPPFEPTNTPVAAPVTGTSFSSFKDTILNKAKAQG